MEFSRDEIRAAVAAQLGSAATEIADHDDLIQMGLNSMRMMSLAGGWRKRGSGITFADLAGSPTIESLARACSAATRYQARNSGRRSARRDSDQAREAAPFPLATMQHAYWIGRSDEQLLGGVAAHLYVEFDGGPIDPTRLKAAVSQLVAAHPMLRTRFLPDGTQQTMAEPGRPVFSVVDLRGQSPDRGATPHWRSCANVKPTSAWELKTVRSSMSR